MKTPFIVIPKICFERCEKRLSWFSQILLYCLYSLGFQRKYTMHVSIGLYFVKLQNRIQIDIRRCDAILECITCCFVSSAVPSSALSEILFMQRLTLVNSKWQPKYLNFWYLKLFTNQLR